MSVLTTQPVSGNHVTPATEPLGAAGAGVASEEFTPREELASLLPALQRHPELDLKTLRYHLEQSDATAADGYWHAAINEARSFLEALVTSIAQVERRESLVAFRKGKESQGGIRLCRRFLVDVGFLDANEDELLQHAYGIASAKGSHHGVTDAAWSRLARRIVLTTGQYLLRRYETWTYAVPGAPASSNGMRDTLVKEASEASGNGRWRRWLARVVFGPGAGTRPARMRPWRSGVPGAGG